MNDISNPPTTYDRICNEFGIKTLAGREALEVAIANVQLLDRKQQDYGPNNIAEFGMFGVVVRMTDKFWRLKNLLGKGRRRKAQNESVRDSFRDIANYATIAILLDTKKWPQSETQANP